MPLSVAQLAALQQARKVLHDAGLLESNNAVSDNDQLIRIQNILDSHLTPVSNPLIQKSQYTPSLAALFTVEEISAGRNQTTRQGYVQGIIEHPAGAIVEFPQTGSKDGKAIAHHFSIDLKSFFVNPKDNIQYSLGDNHGSHANVTCHLLHDPETQSPVLCHQLKNSCRCIKHCSFNGHEGLGLTLDVPQGSSPSDPATADAPQEVFLKTLTFYCALREHGCPFEAEVSSCANKECSPRSHKDHETMGDYFEAENPAQTNTHHVRCEKHCKGHHAHLILHNLNEFDIHYLQALLNNDLSMICSYKEAAFLDGYGPLAPCHSAAIWHRDSHGILTRGIMVHTKKCPAVFEFYYPYDLDLCPYILLVCRNPHSHVNPKSSKTPQAVLDVFNSLPKDLGWKLADATLRRIILDSAFVNGLRHALGWAELCDPTLGDLHPSLSNADHAVQMINKLRDHHYPQGTGLEGAYHILAEHAQLPLEKRYVRCVEEHKIPGEGKIYIVICMFRAMSELLLKTKRPSIDTSFKRLHKWQEFEIEAWFPEYLRSIVVAHAFTTSQSAEAHHILFNRIFAIVHEDTGKTVQFQHIHGVGFNTFMADGHLGQALGEHKNEVVFAKVWLYCAIEWTKALYMLTPYEHLARIYRYCFAHFVRKLTLKGYVSLEVQAAMMSLALAEPLPILKPPYNKSEGGKKAADWLKNKHSAGGFALAALYQPASKIPIEVWKAFAFNLKRQRTSTRSINRDGVKLTMLAGIMWHAV
ncbi:hypothetical protein K439DRAFT_1324584 [Ramaria rubella]|nr:hypothetical protein K439DRAFT_1324584 [Ramaria rubella]